MYELTVDFIISLDGYASAEGWPGFWGLESPEYLAWLEEDGKQDYTVLMGANTYRLMSEFAAMAASGSDDLREEETSSLDDLTRVPTVVFSSTIEGPLAWANTVRSAASTNSPAGVSGAPRASSVSHNSRHATTPYTARALCSAGASSICNRSTRNPAFRV